MRHATLDDSDAIFDIARADGGELDWTPATVRKLLSAAGSDAFVAGEDGRVVGFALLNGINATVTVHPDAAGRGIGSRLREEVERRAHGPVIRQEIASSDRAAHALLERAGYECEQRYWRMQRELATDEPAPAWPPGAAPRALDRPGDDRAAYELVAAAMREIPGNTERTFEQWSERALTESLAPELSTVAGPMAGIVLCHRHPDARGYIDYIAVASAWRGRGLGRTLMQESFHRFAAAGMRRAVLWVNSKNEPATHLYEAVGMEVTSTSDDLVKRL